MLICKYCGKECKNENSLRNHERTCKLNPKRQVTYFSKPQTWRIPWNKGLTKDTNEMIAKKAKILSDKYRSGELVNHQKGVKRTTEEKLKISATMKKNKKSGGLRPRSGRGKKGSYKGYYCDSTYELAYVIYNLDHNITFERCPRSIFYEYLYNGEIRKYYPDFILSDGSLVEIKGYHTDVVDIKIKSVTDRKIVVLYKKDLKYAFDYIKDFYKVEKLEEMYLMENELGAAS